MSLLNALLAFIPRLDPKKENYAKFAIQYRTIHLFLVALFCILQVITLSISLGATFIRVDFLLKLLIGGMFVLFGNMMPKLKFNYFVGIKTPWTLSSENVWNKSHRHGGLVWFVSGCLLIVLAFIPGTFSAILYFYIVILATVEPIGYSYILFKQEKSPVS